MEHLSKIFSFLWRCWFVFLSTLATIFFGVFLVLPLSFRNQDFAKAYFFERMWAKTIFYGSGLSLKKHGFPNIDESHPYLIISNHTSMMDIMLMLLINKKPMAFVGKKELMNLPIFGYIFSRMNIVVDRKDPNSRSKVIRDAMKNVQLGRSICIFPEGGVPEREIMLDNFLDGPFAIAIMNKIPLLTISICGLKEILPYSYCEGKPGLVDVYFHQTLETSRLNKTHIPEIKETCYEMIYSQLKRYYWRKERGWPSK